MAAFENVFYSVNAQSALKLGHVRGVSLLAAAEAGIRFSNTPRFRSKALSPVMDAPRRLRSSRWSSRCSGLNGRPRLSTLPTRWRWPSAMPRVTDTRRQSLPNDPSSPCSRLHVACAAIRWIRPLQLLPRKSGPGGPPSMCSIWMPMGKERSVLLPRMPTSSRYPSSSRPMAWNGFSNCFGRPTTWSRATATSPTGASRIWESRPWSPKDHGDGERRSSTIRRSTRPRIWRRFLST